MAIKKVGAKLKIDSSEAIAEVKKLVQQIEILRTKASKPISIDVKIDNQAIQNIKNQLKNALQQVKVSVTNPNGGGDINKSRQQISQLNSQAQQANQTIGASTSQAINHVTNLVEKSGGIVKSSISGAISEYRRLVSSMNATSNGIAPSGYRNYLSAIIDQKSRQQSFNNNLGAFYRGGLGGFNSDIDRNIRDGLGQLYSDNNLPALLQSQEVLSSLNQEISSVVKNTEGWGEVLEGEVIDEYGNLRSTASSAHSTIIDGVEDLTDYYKRLGRNISSVGMSIQRAGRSITQIGSGLTNFSTKSLNIIKNIGSSALQTTALLGISTREIIGDAVEDIKTLEYAQVGLRNQFSRKEDNFDIDAYIEQIRQTARTTMGVSAGDLTSYLSQVAPVAQNSQQAYNVTMGLLKAITYSGGQPSEELGYVVRNLRDVLGKGNATQRDVEQFNRAIPGLSAIFQDLGLTQFLDKSGQLDITKDNIDGLLEAFAQLNSESSPIYGILDEMNTSLGGLLEESNETIQQAVERALQDSGLLDTWKALLQNDNISNFIEQMARGTATSISNFLNSVDGTEIMNTFFEVVQEVGQYTKDTVMPALKNALGLDENATLTDVITEIIKALGDLAKGLADGAKFSLDFIATLRQFTDTLKEIGIDIGSLPRVFGWLITAGITLGPLVSLLGNIITGIGRFTDILGKLIGNSGGGILSKAGGSISRRAGGLLTTVNGKLGTELRGSKIIGGLGITAVGHMLSESASEWISKGDVTARNIIKDGADLVSTFAGITLAAGPLAGILVTFGEALVKTSNGLEEYYNTVQEGRQQTIDDSLSALQTAYIGQLRDNLRAQGLYTFEDDNSEDALVAAMRTVKEFDASSDPQQVMEATLNTYMERLARNITADKFSDYLTSMSTEGTSDYVAGYSPLSNTYAKTEEGFKQLRFVLDRVTALGMINPTAGTVVDDYNGEEILRFLNRQGFKFDSIERLNAAYEYLQGSVASEDALRGRATGMQFEVDGIKLEEDVNSYMNKLGFYLGPDNQWGTTAAVEVKVEIAKESNARAEVEQRLGIKDLQAGKATIELDFSIPGAQGNNFRDWLASKGVSIPAPVKPHSSGGYITPIYRASGGNTPAMGVDTVPAMLAPGEFVQKASSVKHAGLAVMEALNHGDLKMAYNLIGARIHGNSTRYTTNKVNANRTQQNNTNYFFNYGQSSRTNSYIGLKNRMALR